LTRREGRPIEAAHIHDLKAADRQPVDVSPVAIAASEQTVQSSVDDLRQRIYRTYRVHRIQPTTGR
jgi:hypothetical protein